MGIGPFKVRLKNGHLPAQWWGVWGVPPPCSPALL